jgi:hypothetical protein
VHAGGHTGEHSRVRVPAGELPLHGGPARHMRVFLPLPANRRVHAARGPAAGERLHGPAGQYSRRRGCEKFVTSTTSSFTGLKHSYVYITGSNTLYSTYTCTPCILMASKAAITAI